MVLSIYKRPWIIISICALITMFFALQLPKLRIENDAMFEYLPHDTADYQRLLQAEEDYGSVYSIGISLETDASSFFTPQNLTIVNRITKDLEFLDNIDNVDSLTNIDYVCAEDGSLVSSNLVPEDLFTSDDDGSEYFCGTDDDIQNIIEKLGSWREMYNRVIVSDDYRAVQFALRYINKKENAAGDLVRLSGNERLSSLAEIEAIVERAVEGSSLHYTIYGDPVISKNSRIFMLRDIFSLIPMVVLIVIISLFVSFKTADGTVLPLLTVLMAAIWSCGLMALLGVQFSIISSVIPVALIAVDSAYGIHVLTHYYIALDKVEGELTKEKHAEAIMAGVRDVFRAVLLAGITTIVGFISLITSPLQPLHGFAVFTSVGVLLALILSVVFIPAMLMLKPLDKVGRRSERLERIIARTKNKAKNRLNRIKEMTGSVAANKESGSTLYRIYSFFAGTLPRLVLLVFVIVVTSFLGIKRLIIDTSFINYFPVTSKPRMDVNYVNDRFAGTATVYMLVTAPYAEGAVSSDDSDTDALLEFGFDDAASSAESFASDSNDDFDFGSDFGFDSSDEAAGAGSVPLTASQAMTNVDVLYALEGLQNYLQARNPEIGKVVSFTTFLKRMNQVMNAPGEGGSAEGYADALSKSLSYEDMLKLLSDSVIASGGANASVDDVVETLSRKLNYNGLAYYEVPHDVRKYPVETKDELSDLVSQYIMLLGGDTLDRFAKPVGSFTPSQLRVQIQIRKNSTVFVGKVIRDAKKYVEKYFPEGYTVEFTGTGQMECVMTDLIIRSQLISLLISLLSVFLIISISFKSGWAGLVGIIPLALTIFLNYMVMGFSGIRLDLITSIIASVAVGVGIDYTIHFLETFRNERRRTDDMKLVLKATFTKTGSGIVTNALAIGFGFLVLCFSQFVVLRYIGILVAIVMFTSSLLALTIIPGILHLTDPAFMHPASSLEEK